MRLMPRYVFRSRRQPVGCEQHNDPECLCDIKLSTNNTVEINTSISHPFLNIALGELGDDSVTDRNIVEVFSVMMGAFETFRFRNSSAHQPISQGPPEWLALPVEQLYALRDHYRVGTPWRIAQLELDCVTAKSKVIQNHYNKCRSWHVRAASSKRYAERAARKQDIYCEHCGTLVENADTRRRLCSDACRMAALRDRRRSQYQSRKVTA